MATATHRPRPQKTEEPGDGPTRQEQQTRQSLRLIAESLGMSVESFYASVRPSPGGELSPPVSPAQQLSIDSAELLQAFMTLSEPSDRRLCIAFIQKLAAKQGT